MSVIDLRSDTVTKPSPAMREAMATADVGDDVYGEDPTVNRLQDDVAALLGMDAALFVPSGSMANQIAIAVHTSPGDEIIVGQSSHSWLFESGGAAAIAGVQVRVMDGDGRYSAGDVRQAINPPDHHFAPTTMVTVENTHNMGGGAIWDRDELSAVLEVASQHDLATHLDGARLWNAAAALGVAESDLSRGFDSVSVCLSKGLGAPVGSLIAGSKAFVHRAHRMRKMLGGGMRQAGILAAAGLYAIEHNRERLASDHANALAMAKALARIDGLNVEVPRVETNIVMVDIDSPDLSAHDIKKQAAERGLLLGVIHDARFRLVTHLDVDSAACEQAVKVISEII